MVAVAAHTSRGEGFPRRKLNISSSFGREMFADRSYVFSNSVILRPKSARDECAAPQNARQIRIQLVLECQTFGLPKLFPCSVIILCYITFAQVVLYCRTEFQC